MNEATVAAKIAEINQDRKSINRRLDNIERLTESVHTIAVEMKAMREDVNGLTKRIAAIESKPIKRWDSIVQFIITTLVGGGLGYLIAFFK